MPFARVCREIAYDIRSAPGTIRFQRSALEAIQEAAEAYLVGQFEGN